MNIGRSILGRGFMLVALLSFSLSAAGAVLEKQLSIPSDSGNIAVNVLYPSDAQKGAKGFVFFNPGFLCSHAWYNAILQQIAGQGFVVMAPQIVESDGIPLGKISPEKESIVALQLLTWSIDNLARQIPVTIDFEKVVLAGHSRGGKVATLMLQNMRDYVAKDRLTVKALILLDPVDNLPRLQRPLAREGVPTMIIGTGLGGKKADLLMPPCAPFLAAYLHYYAIASSPAYLIVASEFGHMDLLDEGVACGLICTVCKGAPTSLDKQDFRDFIGAAMAGFLADHVATGTPAFMSFNDVINSNRIAIDYMQK